MLNRRSLLAGAAGLGAALLLPIRAFASSWGIAGFRTLNLDDTTGTIAIGAGKGPFGKLAIRSSLNDLFVSDVKVTFGSGAVETYPVDLHLAAGSDTPLLSLGRLSGPIDQIDLNYRSRPGAGLALVMISGQPA